MSTGCRAFNNARAGRGLACERLVKATDSEIVLPTVFFETNPTESDEVNRAYVESPRADPQAVELQEPHITGGESFVLQVAFLNLCLSFVIKRVID